MDKDHREKSAKQKIVTSKLETNSRFAGTPLDDNQMVPTLCSTIAGSRVIDVDMIKSFFDILLQHCNNNRKSMKRELSKLNVGLDLNNPRDVEKIVAMFQRLTPQSIPKTVSKDKCNIFGDTFTLIEKIGRGGFGQVFKALNETDQKCYAIKRVKISSKSDKVLKEAKLLADLLHPNIVRYHTAWCDLGNHYWTSSSSKSSSDDETNGSVSSSDANNENVLSGPGAQNSDKSGKDSSKSSSEDFVQFDKNCTTPHMSTDPNYLMSEVSKRIENVKIYEFPENNDSNDYIESMKFKKKGSKIVEINKLSSTKLEESTYSNQKDSFETKNSGNNFNELGQHFDISSNDEYSYYKKTTWNNKKSSLMITIIDEDGISVDDSSMAKLKCARTSQGASKIVEKQKLSVAKVMRNSVTAKKEYMFLNIQMELCDSTLRHWIDERNDAYFKNKEKSINDQSNKTVFMQILEAVSYIHAKEIIHRDLKPSNILFANNIVKVADFGLACGNFSSDSTANNFKTCDVGTAFYISPEMKQLKTYNNKTDIYSLGVIFYEMYVPFVTKMEAYMALQSLTESSIHEKMSKEFHDQLDVVRKMIAKNPEERPEAAELRSCELFKENSR